MNNSLDLLKQYIVAHDLQPKYLLGVTYARMGRVAHRGFGFDISTPNTAALPDEVAYGLKAAHQRLLEAGVSTKNTGLPVLVFKETGAFLAA